MKIAIMQPYFFPYIGYFQLINAVDVFVLYDDVHFIKKGWINRNRILLNGKAHLFTIPCKDSSQNRLISETEIAFGGKAKDKLIRTIQMAYKRAPYYHDVLGMIEEVILSNSLYLHEIATKSIQSICSFLSIETLLKSSLTYRNQSLKKEDRLIDICKNENILEYINAEGGQEIYTKDSFAAKSIFLSFIKPKLIRYNQLQNEFVPGLSMIDVMMFNSIPEIKNMLLQYELK